MLEDLQTTVRVRSKAQVGDRAGDSSEDHAGNKAKDEDDSVGDPLPSGEVEAVQDPVATPNPYTCGRCSEGIFLDSTFYRCVGHSCRGGLTW